MSSVTDQLATAEKVESERIARRLASGIREQLEVFHQIRRSNRALSGFSGWATITLAALFVCILIDAGWVAPVARWAASGLFYLATGAAGWCLIVRRLVRAAPDWIAEARLLERRSRRLKNLLVAAVELAARPLPSGTSGEFAGRVQEEAEEAIESLDIRDLAPRQSRVKAMRQLQIAGAVTLLACLLPWFHVPSRIARVLFPMANLGRISWVTISLTQPLPHTKKIAQGEIVVIEAEFLGPWRDAARLETRSPKSTESSEAMILSSGPSASGLMSDVSTTVQDHARRARSTLTTDQAWVEYRVTSQNASTPWYRLNAFPRPAVESIAATVSPPITPPGNRLSDFVASFDSENRLEVLRGSRIKLELTTNLPPVIAELRWLSGTAPLSGDDAYPEDQSPIAEPDASNRPSSSLVQADGCLRIEITVDSDVKFQIHLVDAENGFSNAFARPYEISVIDDDSPELEWITPRATDHLVTSDQLFELHLQANDELPLSELELRWRSNGGTWQVIADADRSAKAHASNTLSRQEQISAVVDFLQLNVEYGDLIEISGRAVDSSGQETLSRSQRMTVVANQSQEVIGSAEESQFDIAARLDEFADKVERYAGGPARQSLRALEIVTGLRADLQQLIGFALSTASDLSSEEGKLAISLVGSALADVNAQLALHSARLEQSSVDSVETRADVKRVVAGLRTVSQHFRAVLSVQVIQSVADAVKIVADAQSKIQDAAEALAESGATKRAPPDAKQIDILTLSRQQRAVYLQVEYLQQLITDAAARIDPSMAPMLVEVANRIDNAANGAGRDIRNTNIRTLSHSAGRLSNELRRYQTVAAIHTDWAADLIADLSGISKFNQAAHAPDRLARTVGIASDDTKEYLSVAFAMRYRVGRSFQRATQPGFGRLASDLGYADRATRAQAGLLAGPSLAVQLHRIESAVQLLRVEASSQAMQRIVERIGSFREASGAARSLDQSWCVAAASFSSVADSARKSSMAASLLPQLGRVASLVGSVPARTLSNPAGRLQLATIDRQLLKILPMLDIEAGRARRFLKSLSPNVSKLADTAAEQTQQLALVTSDLAGATQRNTAASVEAEVRQLASQVADRGESIDDLRDALIDIAESQDLLNAAGIATSKQADRAREQVDVSREQVQDSLSSVDLSAPESALAQQLRSGAEQQQAAADRLAQVARQLRNSPLAEEDSVSESDAAESRSPNSDAANSGDRPMSRGPEAKMDVQDSQGSANRPPGPAQPAQPDAEASGNEQAYSDAESLAEFAAETPEEMLAKLEAYLPTSNPMQRELSSIAQEALADALEGVLAAREKYQRLSSSLALSDIDAKVRSSEIEFEIEFASTALRETSAYLLSQTRAASALSGNKKVADSLHSEHTRIMAELAKLQNRSREAGRADTQPISRAYLLVEFKAIAQAVSELWQIHHARLELSQAESRHSGDRDLRMAKQDAADRLRRTTQYLGRMTLSQKRTRDRQLGNTLGTVSQLKADVDRATEMLAKQNSDRQQTAGKAMRRLAWRKAQLDAQQAFAQRLQAKAELAQAEVETVNQLSSLDTKSGNPAAELALRLLEELSRSAGALAAEIGNTTDPIAEPRIAEHTLDANRNVPDSAAEILTTARGIIQRMTRHEARLANSESVETLREAIRGISSITRIRTTQAKAAMQAAQKSIEDAGNGGPHAGRATLIASAQTISAGERLMADTTRVEQLLSGLLRGVQPETPLAPPMSTVKPPLPMRPDELANLLDQLDRQLNEEAPLGVRDNDSSGAPNSSGPPQQLSETAGQIAQSLAKGRRLPTQQTSGDLATATENQQADVRPQGPTAVQMLDVQRLNGQWGQLRQQITDEAVENARVEVPAQYRSQVDAYFRALGNKAVLGDER